MIFLIPTNVPEELKGLPQWAVFNMETSSNPQKNRAQKIPRDPLTGQPVKVNEPGTWRGFETCCAAVAEDEYDGVSFRLTPDDTYTGLDLDNCRDPDTGIIADWAMKIVKRLNSYTEISPSGTGLRIFVNAKLPPRGRHKGKIEMYDSGRALTVTGNHLEGTPKEIHDRQEQVEEIHAEIFGSPVDPKPSKPTTTLTEEEIEARLEKAFKSSNGQIIRDLYEGHWEKHYPSHSEADQAFCNNLVFWLGEDPVAIDAVVRMSGLDRTKWVKKHGTETYGEQTIAKAIADTKEVYKEPSIPNYVEEMNRKHAVILHNGRCLIMNIFEGPTGEKEFSFSSFSDLNNYYANKTVLLETDTTKTKVPIAKAWLQSPFRKEYRGIVFEPSQIGDVNGCYNLFQGLETKPKPGSWEKFKNHIREVIANGDPKVFDYIMAWLADAVQNIGKQRPGVALVMRGGQGAGKGMFVNNFGKIFGDHFICISSQRQLTGNFNSHLKGSLLTFLDEAIWAGDKAAEGVLKAMITEDYQMIEQKGRDAIKLRNHSRYIMASNNEWVVPAGMDERRFFVLDVSNAKAGNHTYFEALQHEMDNGGREAMLHDLLEYDLTGINLRDFPKTNALLDQKINSMGPVDKFWLERLRAGMTLEGSSGWLEAIPTNQLYEEFLAYHRKVSGAKHKPSSSEFAKRLRRVCPDVDRKRMSLSGYGCRQWCLVFPDLSQCRDAFGRYVNAEIDWEGF